MPIEAQGPPIAYGLQFHGPLCRGLERLLSSSSETLPAVAVSWSLQGPIDAVPILDSDHAVLPLLLGGHLVADRARSSAVFAATPPMDAQDLAHPGLAPVGAVFSHWLGRLALHGGAVAIGARAWGILGEKGAGKSTTLTALALAGFEIIADDLLVIEEGQALIGPRTIDVRPDAAARFAANGAELVSVRSGERHRLLVGAMAARTELGGWIVLDVARHRTAERVPPSARPQVLASHFTVRVPPVAAAAQPFMALAALPMWRISRRREWADLPDTVATIAELAGR